MLPDDTGDTTAGTDPTGSGSGGFWDSLPDILKALTEGASNFVRALKSGSGQITVGTSPTAGGGFFGFDLPTLALIGLAIYLLKK